MTLAAVQQLFIPLARTRLKPVEGTERLPSPPYIIAANHVDFLDGFLVAAAFVGARHPAPYFISKTNNYGWTRATIQVNPDDPTAVLDRALDRLRRGQTMCLFVEGSRNHTPTLLPGKTGAVRLALAAGVPIVPIGIQGPLPSTYFLGSLWHLLWRPKSVTVRIGEPMRLPDLANPSHEDRRRLTDELMRRIAPLCGKKPA